MGSRGSQDLRSPSPIMAPARTSSHDARWRKTKVFIIITLHNQLSNSWTKTLNLFSKIVNEKFASSNFKRLTEWKRSQIKYKYSVKM